MEAVETLPLGKQIMLPCIFAGNFCIMPMAKSLTKNQRADPEKMAELLLLWYRPTTKTYSEGIYSFARQGRTKKTPGMLYYSYIKQEMDSLFNATTLRPEYAEMEKMALDMWKNGCEKYENTHFWSYHFLHGDLHSGNIVSFRGEYHLIDWECFRTGPKEMELAFYLCWDYFCHPDYPRTLQDMLEEADIFYEKRLISKEEQERILYFLIPMWMLILVLYLNNGHLRMEEERREICKKIILQYKKEIFDPHITASS